MKLLVMQFPPISRHFISLWSVTCSRISDYWVIRYLEHRDSMGRVRRPDVPLLPGFGQIKIAWFHQAEVNRLVQDPFVLLVLTCKLRVLFVNCNDHNSLHANTGVGHRAAVDAVKIKIA
jgi:hypothetical protein